MSVRLTLVIPALVLIAACSESGNDEDRFPAYVTYVDLIIRPEALREQEIAVIGYLGTSVGANLYLTEAHAQFGTLGWNVRLTPEAGILESENCLERYVQVIGKLNVEGYEDLSIAVDEIRTSEFGSVCFAVSIGE